MKYFDYAASCPLDEEAAKVYVHASTAYYGNTQSLHDLGEKANGLLTHCRVELANLLFVEAEGVFFTSGGSESNFLAIQALLSTKKKSGKHIIAGVAEHSSIHSTLEKVALDGFSISFIPFDQHGRIDVSLFKQELRSDTVLAVFQHINGEIGTIQPILEISQLCKQEGVLLHSDCVHSFGKVSLKEISTYVDSLSISAHKFYGPKGIGAAYIHPSHIWKSFYPSTSHESGFRPGTVNVPAIAAMTSAAKKSYTLIDEHRQHYQLLREKFITALEPIGEYIHIYECDERYQLPSTIGVRLKGIEGQYVMLECNRHGFALSTGSACQIGMKKTSKTMEALGLASKEGKEFIRISLGRETTLQDIEQLACTLVKITEYTRTQ